MSFAKPWAAALLCLAAAACTPEIGDSCSSSVDCSVSGDRVCDRSVPGGGGYCTVAGCEADTCPDSAVCVRFRNDPPRLSTSWCMASCGRNSDCRDGYGCVFGAELGEEGFARVLEGENRRFCAYVKTE